MNSKAKVIKNIIKKCEQEEDIPRLNLYYMKLAEFYEEEIKKQNLMIDYFKENGNLSPPLIPTTVPKISHLSILQRNLEELLSNEDFPNLDKTGKYKMVNESLVSPLIDLISLNVRKRLLNLKGTSLDPLIKELLKVEEISNTVQLAIDLKGYLMEKLAFDKKINELQFRVLVLLAIHHRTLIPIFEHILSYKILESCFNDTPLKSVNVQKMLMKEISTISHQIHLDIL
eukprot:gene12263-5847_t